mgnify:CR=1 FL=1
MTLSDWDLPSVVHYYDARTEIVARSARRLQQLKSDEVGPALARIVAGVNARIDELHLDDEGITGLAISAADDLYKTTAAATTWSRETDLYVSASFRALFAAVARRGYQVRYVVANTFPDLQLGISGCSNSFELAGFSFVSPQMYAYALAVRRGILNPGDPAALEDLEPDIAEGRALAQEAAHAATASRRHLAYFDLNPVDGSFDQVMGGDTPAGTITVFRDEAPLPGSAVNVSFVPRR